MRRYRSNSKKTYTINRKFACAAVLLSVLIAISVLLNHSLKPMVLELAESFGSRAVFEMMNEAVEDCFSDETVGYSDIVRLKYNSSGFVTSAEFNSAEINKIKLICAKNLSEKLEKLQYAKIKIPIGSLFNDVSSSGRGFGLTVRISEAAAPNAEIISSFEAVGINQSRHEVRLRLTASVRAYLPPESVVFEVTQEYVLAQTVIVGNVPEGRFFIE